MSFPATQELRSTNENRAAVSTSKVVNGDPLILPW